MTLFVPRSVNETYAVLSHNSDACLLAGGTDFMAELNYRHRGFTSAVSLRHVGALREWYVNADQIEIGAGVRYTDIMNSELAQLAPALAQAARTVGSPQIRNTGTIGGNIATASPAGDTLPVLVAMDAVVKLGSMRGIRMLPLSEFITGVKRTVREPDEIILSVSIPVAKGPQEFLKIGKRNAMVIAVANLALIVDREKRRIGAAIGAVGPTIIRCTGAEQFAAEHIDWDTGGLTDSQAVSRFGALCAEAAMPIDDHRASAAYRRHAISVLAMRALQRVT